MKRLYGILAADFDECVFPGDRSGFSIVSQLPGVGNLCPVAIHQRAVFFYWLDGGSRVAQVFEFVLEFFVGDFDRRLLDNDSLIALDREVGQILKDGLHMEWLSVVDGQFGHLRLTHRLDAQFLNCLVEALREQTVDNVFADICGKAAADNGIRHFAGTEAGKLCVLLVVANHAPEGLGDLFSGNIQYQFAGSIQGSEPGHDDA